MPKYNTVGTEHFLVSLVKSENRSKPVFDLVIGSGASQLFEPDHLDELIDLLIQARRLFGLEKKTVQAPTTQIGGSLTVDARTWIGDAPVKTFPKFDYITGGTSHGNT